MKKPFTSNNMYKIGLRNYKEKHINRVSLQFCTESKEEVLEND